MAEQTPTLDAAAAERLAASVMRMNTALRDSAAPLDKIFKLFEDIEKKNSVTILESRFRSLGGEIKAVHSQVTTLGGSIATLASGPLSRLGALGRQGLSFLVNTAGPEIIKASAENEKYQTRLTTLMGSSAKATEAMGWIGAFAQKTPYDSATTADAFITLKNQGLDPTDGTLQTLGDAATTLGKPLKDAVAALVNGTMGSMESLRAFGVNAQTKGETITMTFTDKDGVEKTLSAAKGEAVELQKTILAIFEAKGFTGAMDSASKTWDGMWESLTESVSDFWGMIGNKETLDFLKGKLQALLDLIQSWKEDGRLQAWATRISSSFTQIFNILESKLAGVDWDKAWERLSTGIADVITALTTAVDAVGGWENALLIVAVVLNADLISSIVKLGGHFLALVPLVASVVTTVGTILMGLGTALVAANPVMAIAAAIAAVAYLIYRNWGNLPDFFRAIGRGIAAAASAIVDFLKEPFHEFSIWFLTWMSGVLDGALTWVSGLGESIRSAFSEGIVQGISRVLELSLIVPALVTFVQGFLRFLTGIDLYGVGVGLIQSLFDGIASMWKELGPSLSKGLDDWVPGWAKDMLGIKAPVVPDQASVTPSAGVPAVDSSRKPASALIAGAMAGAMATLPVPALAEATATPTLPTGVGRMAVGAPATAGNSQAVARVAQGPLMPPVGAMAPAVREAALPGVGGAASPATPPPAPPPASASPPAPASSALVGASRTINAPVSVSITVNGMADLDTLQWEVGNAVRRAMNEWSDRQQSDATASLHDLY